MRTAIRDASRPMPENNAIATSGLLSGLSNEPVDAEIGTKTRAAFGISGFSNAYVIQTPQPEEQSSQPRRRFNALSEFREIPSADDGTGQRNLTGPFVRSRCPDAIICQ
jgi:hypothetical protein